ncbi:sugar kinase [Romboutsia lituseburensis]|uniref:sugar kinase n=1 Tax=Romboutsia lituseburensis TaxID=1537 RepID=UPI00215A5BE9|nr:sugar kinase [Romboutsia lituseburensis]MCR8743832.1 sugar kinase [Romboutsia lituseburensis]
MLEANKNNNILGFGEIMLRLTPSNNQKIMQVNSFDATYGGGEANVVCSLANFGHKTKYVTKVPNNSLGDKVIRDLKSYNVDTSDILQGDGRLGIYFLEIGHGLRSTEVIYDRKYSSISMTNKNEFDIEKMLEDVKLVHLSGITPALSKELYDLTIDIAKFAKKTDILVSLDSNYRAKLWSLENAKEFLEEILPYVDIAFLGNLDMTNILKYESKKIGYEESLKDLYEKLFKKYPNLKYAACTKRSVNSINNNSLKGYLFDKENLHVSNEYNFDILDRVGGGDAYTAGILHGILDNLNSRETVEFGTCASVLKHSIRGDINLVDRKSVSSLIEEGLQNIKR